jgi:hypothetical protein
MPPSKQEIALDDFLDMIAAPDHLTVQSVSYDEATGIVAVWLTTKTVEAPE